MKHFLSREVKIMNEAVCHQDEHGGLVVDYLNDDAQSYAYIDELDEIVDVFWDLETENWYWER